MHEPTTGETAARDEVLRLFLQHQDMLGAFVFALTEDWEVVEEALQETAVFLCSHWQDFTPGTNFPAWARSVARMRAREVLQKRRRSMRQSSAELESVAAPVSEAEWDAHGRFSAAHKTALAQCVKTLPEPHRAVIALHYQDKLACDAIAARLQKTVDAVYMTLSRIRKRLRQCVEQRVARES